MYLNKERARMKAQLLSKATIAVVVLSCFYACSLVQEDLSDCEVEVDVEYDVSVKTNLRTEIQTELTARLETDLAVLLYDSLKNVFREYAHDVDLSFYINEQRRYHMQHIMDAGEASYTLELPADNYYHLALANIQEEQQAAVDRDDNASSTYLHQVTTADTVPSHQTALFTAREMMNIQRNVDQTFQVKLYMANCAAILVVRTDGIDYKDMKTYYTGLGNGFHVKDSTFTFQKNQVVEVNRVTQPPVERECFYAITFPSHDTHEQAFADMARTRDDGPVARANSIWEMHFYATMPDDHIVETKLFIDKPLEAGQVMIIYGVLQPNGEVFSPNVEVGTSVNFDWKPGMHF